MSGLETADGRLDEARLGSALLELESGTIEPAERDELMALVARSPAAQRAYLAHFEMTAMLEAEAATHAEAGRLPVLPRAAQAARMFRRSLLAAAALVAIGAVVATWIKVARPAVPELELTAAATSQWAVDGETHGSDRQRATLREGSTVRVESGTLELRLESGAAMIMQGPAEVSFPKLNQPVVRSGWLWIDSGGSGETFAARTPDLRIRNLGTRFGIRVPAEGPAEVHLIKGRLEVTGDRQTGGPLELVAGEQAWAIPQLGDATSLPLARDPFPEIAGLLAAPANYPTTVRGQNPTGYWRLENASDGRLANEVPGGSTGRSRPGASSPPAGPGPGNGFAGFANGNTAAGFAGFPDGAPLSLGAAHLHRGLLYHDLFDGSGPLHRLVPTGAPAETAWVAAPNFRGDGVITPGRGSATLAFKPVGGVVYTLEATLRDVTTPEGDKNWVALGFAGGQSTGEGLGDRLIDGAVVGRAWMLFRGTGSKFGNTALLAGASDSRFWNGWAQGVGGDIDLRIVLDTTGGAGAWTATWFARRPGQRDYIKVRNTCRLPNESIQSVGIATSGDQVRGRISRFSLTAAPATPDHPDSERADGPARITRPRGTVSWWLRREPGIGHTEILWSAGEGPTDHAVHARLEAGGRVGLFIENGRYDVLLTSEQGIADGRWHHLVASWGPMSATLYLDGQRVAHEPDFLGTQQENLPELRAGGDPAAAGGTPFTGWIDEIACWDRALSPIEVERQFQSALGADPR